jgi:hypothetical protein
MPFFTATWAFAVMNAKLSTASATNPPRFFGFQEFADPLVLNFGQIFEHAHAVFKAVAFIEVAEAVAGELLTLGAAKLVAGY